MIDPVPPLPEDLWPTDSVDMLTSISMAASNDESVATPVIYISGPMTGYPEYNFPAFRHAEQVLRRYDLVRIENPARHPQIEGWSWQDYMRRALQQMLVSDHVVVLPGWTQSQGAQWEVRIARMLGMPVVAFSDLSRKLTEHCPGCRASADDSWFDRSLCFCTLSGVMHQRCGSCGTALDGCGEDSEVA